MTEDHDLSKATKFDLERLRALISAERANARITQDDVAATIGCSRKWVSRFERGLSVPNFENVIAYASMFGIGISMDIPERVPDLELPSRGISKVE
ncbi:helix-turn-helix domain-containing protein [Rhizobium sp. BK176]|uniref:helix-turn-helix domain-containing protein n=1 Tax=Rhizobium sp. BK176 TaxID=2587071 RepID=UPI002167082A|nr:helix-turn-helix transcriptional regulator [Rhizobium sp. BK176]MCS4088696.1 transcriptional regulator with XRE-family HTH domain [Rhizobium sp. BK176]